MLSVTITKSVEVDWWEQRPDCNESRKREELDKVSTDNFLEVLLLEKKI